MSAAGAMALSGVVVAVAALICAVAGDIAGNRRLLGVGVALLFPLACLCLIAAPWIAALS